ncbi:MAG: DEAD/DEAH box helicase [Planctomycetes bacterium]|jgi:Rad3-related DNA helicase|nr:DEAD/DEAH box helicase [Planctomycetota bacterium]MBT7129302.1 DEAD/DEAH box helicase [Planctomycetota bacterium]
MSAPHFNEDLLDSVFSQIQGRGSLASPLDASGPLGTNQLLADQPLESVIEENEFSAAGPKGYELRNRAGRIQNLFYESGSLQDAVIVDIEASFSRNFIELREICILDFHTGSILLDHKPEQALRLSLLGGTLQFCTQTDFAALQEQLLETLEGKTWIGHNPGFDFDVIDRIANFNISKFDPKNLKMKFRNVNLIDTRHLSLLLNPLEPSHSLESLYHSLGLTGVTQFHVAKYDCEATREIARKFIEVFRTMAMPVDNLIVEAVEELTRRHPVKRLLGLETDRKPHPLDSSRIELDLGFLEFSSSAPEPPTTSPDVDRALGVFNGVLGERGHEMYPGQEDFTRSTLKAIENHQKVAIEAGTGTGKTYAYLTSAIESIRSGHNAVIATPTIPLQKQVWESALEFRKQLKESSFDLRVAQVIGAQNFISLQGLYNLSRNKDHGHPEFSFLIAYLKLRLYRFESPHSPQEEPDQYLQDYLYTGCIDHLPSAFKRLKDLTGFPESLIRCQSGETVHGKKLKRLHFPSISMKQQETAHLHIENHALFFRKRLTNLDETGRANEVVVIDEAHKLLDEGTAALTDSLSCQELALLLHESRQFLKDSTPPQLTPVREKLWKHQEPLLQDCSHAGEEFLLLLRRTLKRHRQHMEDFEEEGEDTHPQRTVSYRAISTDEEEIWTDLIITLDQFREIGTRIQTRYKKGLEELEVQKESFENSIAEETESGDPDVAGSNTNSRAAYSTKVAFTDFRSRLERLARSWDEFLKTVNRTHDFVTRLMRNGFSFDQKEVLSFLDEEPIGTLEFPAGEGRFKWAMLGSSPLWQLGNKKRVPLFPAAISVAPLWPGPLLKQLWDRAAAAIFTSGTLTIDGSYERWKEWSGFEGEGYVTDKPIHGFDTPSRLKVFHNNTLNFDPLADRETQDRRLALETARAVLMLGGGTLCLFTARQSLGFAAELLRASPHFLEQKLELYAQEPDGLTRSHLRKKFKNSQGRGVLLGARSFWEGVDIPGVVHSLIIPRLPFPNIGDPVHSARCEWYDEGFANEGFASFEMYILPLMLQQLRQGLGRGIRKKTDRCVVFILDSRAGWSTYADRVARLFLPGEDDSDQVDFVMRNMRAPECYLLGSAALAEDDGSLGNTPIYRTKDESDLLHSLQNLSNCDSLDDRIQLGFQSFSGAPAGSTMKHHQQDAIQTMLESREGDEIHAFVRATGGGKSAIYKTVAGLEREHGLTVVISPLISLMTDQALKSRGGSEGIRSLDSMMPIAQRNNILSEITQKHSRVHLLLTSPERLANPELYSALKERGVSRIIIDEAHLLLNWGDSFRSHYQRIPMVVRELEKALQTKIPITLFSATLLPDALESLRRRLQHPVQMDWDPDQDPTYRQRLVPEVIYPQESLSNNKSRRLWQLKTLTEEIKKLIDQGAGQCLVFVRNRADTVHWTLALRTLLHECNVFPFFSNVPQRRTIEKAFNEGDPQRQRVLVTTSAFGMGVDNQRIQAVFHLDLPLTLTDFVQECGRAGRNTEATYPGRHVFLFPGPQQPEGNVHAMARDLSIGASQFLDEREREKWDEFNRDFTPLVTQSTLFQPDDIEIPDPSQSQVQPFDLGNLSRRWLIQEQIQGRGQYIGDLPPEFISTDRVFEEYPGLSSNNDRHRWRDGVDPREAWNFCLELYARYRQRKVSFRHGPYTESRLMAFEKDPSARETSGSTPVSDGSPPPSPDDSHETLDLLLSGNCLRTNLYTSFCDPEKSPPACDRIPLEEDEWCSNCRAARQSEKEYRDDVTGYRSEKDKWTRMGKLLGPDGPRPGIKLKFKSPAKNQTLKSYLEQVDLVEMMRAYFLK